MVLVIIKLIRMKSFALLVAILAALQMSTNKLFTEARNIIVDEEEPVGDKAYCCYLYGSMYWEYDADGEDRDYARMEVCLAYSPLFRKRSSIFAKSFENTSDPDSNRMNDNMESYKCGDKVSMEICKGVYTISEYVVKNPDGTAVKTIKAYKCTGVDGTLSVASPGDRVKRYFKNMNLATSVIVRAQDSECLVTYSAYDEPNCEGYSKTTTKSYNNREEINAAFPTIMKDDT